MKLAEIVALSLTLTSLAATQAVADTIVLLSTCFAAAAARADAEAGLYSSGLCILEIRQLCSGPHLVLRQKRGKP